MWKEFVWNEILPHTESIEVAHPSPHFSFGQGKQLVVLFDTFFQPALPNIQAGLRSPSWSAVRLKFVFLKLEVQNSESTKRTLCQKSACRRAQFGCKGTVDGFHFCQPELGACSHYTVMSQLRWSITLAVSQCVTFVLTLPPTTERSPVTHRVWLMSTWHECPACTTTPNQRLEIPPTALSASVLVLHGV